MNLPDPGASGRPDTSTPSAAGPAREPAGDDTIDLRLTGELADLLAEHEQFGRDGRDASDGRVGHTRAAADLPGERPGDGHGPPPPAPEGDLLDSVGDWPASATPVGTLRLVPVRMDRDLRLIAAWMNDPAVAAFWELAGPREVTAAHLRAQLEGDGRSVPCLGVLDGVPMSYWEIYRADLDPIARHCRARPHDTGLHVLIGGVPDRGRGIGTALLRAVADLVLDQRPRCGRVLAEPAVRNVASVAAFLSAGFRLSAEVDLPGKRAALMVRDRALRDVL
ncbi:hypothetical protein DB35_10890 [Streptomyces abyssalis]|uniref:Lysine N-acyltransferase MbtK n=1 Tax=Streptomyces abyssalis TaxID=933944 RepID=A0A1E7JHS2_9ACTN|nr:GNAT family N-acetyltransferase [Streptomyces abyssalis]OEU86000.1 hypothetical protein AN215_27010 [Streptomyces abyssalis]OEU92533.1 hypothetical protein DB35_10890 [Streptomyces abyssalis]